MGLILGGVLYLGVSRGGERGRLANDEFSRWLGGGRVAAESEESELEVMVEVVEGAAGAAAEAAAPIPVQSEGQDARAILVANFIERNDVGKDSPLQPYDNFGILFVQIADEFGLDFRLLPALARKESTFCKSNIARTYFNCFGYGVPASGITEAGKFSSYEEGIRTVAASLKRNYLDKGLTTPEEIMQKYCPPSAEGSGSWADNLNQWMAEMQYDDKVMGKEMKTNISVVAD